MSSFYPDRFLRACSNPFPLSLPPFHQIWLNPGEEPLRRHEGWAGEVTKLYRIGATSLGNANESITAAFSEARGTRSDLTYPPSLSHPKPFTGSSTHTHPLYKDLACKWCLARRLCAPSERCRAPVCRHARACREVGTGRPWQEGAGAFGRAREGDKGPHKQPGLLASGEVGHGRGGGKGLCPRGRSLCYKNDFGWIQQ